MRNNKRTLKRIAAIFMLFMVLSVWAGANVCAQNKIKYTYDDAGNRLTRKKEIVVMEKNHRYTKKNFRKRK